MLQNNNAITAFVGSTMESTLSLQPQYSPTGIRARRGPTTRRIGGELSRGHSTRLLSSPFDDYDNKIGDVLQNAANKPRTNTDNRTTSDTEPFLPVPTKIATSIMGPSDSSTSPTDAIALGDNSTMITGEISNNGFNEGNESNSRFSMASTPRKELMDPDEKEGRRLAIASEKLIRFLKEEAPPTSIILLNLVAIIWGSQHAIIKTVVDDCDPAAFTFLRFGLASLIASPYLPGVKQTVFGMGDGDNDVKNERKIDLLTPWRWGIEMGFWMFLGFSLQAIGLQTTTAQRSGFLLYLNVKFVPFFAKIILGREISNWTWLSAFAAFSGTALLALDGQSLGLNVGDIWSVMAAAASAMFILRLEKASSEVENSSELNSTSLAVVAMLSGAWLLSNGNGPQITLQVTETAFAHPLELLYLGAISTALANFIQAKAQKDVPAERASIIYSLDPVYGAFFSWIILGETLGGPQAYVGASIIFVAAATNSVLEFSKEEERKD